jgi:hypothetical protein
MSALERPNLKSLLPQSGLEESFSSAVVLACKWPINAFMPARKHPMLRAGTTGTPTLSKHVQRTSVPTVTDGNYQYAALPN